MSEVCALSALDFLIESASKQGDFTDNDYFHVVDLRPSVILPGPWGSPSAGIK